MIGIPGADKTPAPSLDSIMGEAPPVGSGVAPGVQVRDLAIQEAALAYGARAGLANASQKIDFILNEQRDSLDKTWNIGPLEIVGPSGTKILPPVITERTGVYDQPDANTVLIADDQYEIVAAARFSPVTPLWQTYLIMSWSTPTKPDYSVYPKTDDERAIWKAGIAKGWAAGQAQAIAIFKVNVSRLQRDYAGMLKWEQLVSEGKASAPVVAETLQGVTGGGDKLTVGQGIVRLTAPAQLLPNPANWHAPGQVIQ
ncbi:MAG TPA: type IV secretory system conjugative DNA transfer family protein [Acidocella sp.]|nr:type IV secretory system conjugative DNA transfer family protein [Acidocella sp.]